MYGTISRDPTFSGLHWGEEEQQNYRHRERGWMGPEVGDLPGLGPATKIGRDSVMVG